jgi:hypothetical protein
MMKKRNDKVQGEGDYDAARRYRKDVRAFVATHDVEKAARAAAPRSRTEATELEKAETAGRSRARGSTPAPAARNGK